MGGLLRIHSIVKKVPGAIPPQAHRDLYTFLYSPGEKKVYMVPSEEITDKRRERLQQTIEAGVIDPSKKLLKQLDDDGYAYNEDEYTVADEDGDCRTFNDVKILPSRVMSEEMLDFISESSSEESEDDEDDEKWERTCDVCSNEVPNESLLECPSCQCERVCENCRFGGYCDSCGDRSFASDEEQGTIPSDSDDDDSSEEEQAQP